MVTVVDAANLLKDFSSHDFLRDRGESLGEEDDRALVNLLVEQMEFADVIVLNKVSTATAGERDAARKIVHAINPRARVVETDYSRVALSEVMGTGRFDFGIAQQHPKWFEELYGFKSHTRKRRNTGFRVSSIAPEDPLTRRNSMPSRSRHCRGLFAPRGTSGSPPDQTSWASSASRAP